MLCLEWSVSQAVFVPELDDEHKDIYELLATLRAALAAGMPLPELEKLAGVLAERLDAHFAHEERLMRASRYGSRRWHRRKHDGARKRLRRFLGRLRENDAAAAPALVEYLTPWLHQHMRLPDMMLAAFLRNHRRGLYKMTFRAGTRPVDSCEWVDSRGERFDPA